MKNSLLLHHKTFELIRLKVHYEVTVSVAFENHFCKLLFQNLQSEAESNAQELGISPGGDAPSQEPDSAMGEASGLEPEVLVFLAFHKNRAAINLQRCDPKHVSEVTHTAPVIANKKKQAAISQVTELCCNQ